MTASLIDVAVRVAEKAHRGQFRKGDGKVPYLVHPLRVMARLSWAGVRDEDVLCAAILHDVLEDSSETADGLLAAGLTPRCVRFVAGMTKPIMTTRAAYIDSFRHAEDEAMLIKLADRLDNLADRCWNVERYYIDESRKLLRVIEESGIASRNTAAYRLIGELALAIASLEFALDGETDPKGRSPASSDGQQHFPTEAISR